MESKNFSEKVVFMRDIRIIIGLVMALAPDITIERIAKILNTDADMAKELMAGMYDDADPNPMWANRLPFLVGLLGEDSGAILQHLETIKLLLERANYDNAIITIMHARGDHNPEIMKAIENTLGVSRIDEVRQTPDNSACSSRAVCQTTKHCQRIAGDPCRCASKPNNGQCFDNSAEITDGIPETTDMYDGLPENPHDGEDAGPVDTTCDENGYPLPDDGPADLDGDTDAGTVIVPDKTEDDGPEQPDDPNDCDAPADDGDDENDPHDY